MAKKRSMHYLNARDCKLLVFLWKHKVATTAMLYHKFFEDVTLRTAYNRLCVLRKHKRIAIRTNGYGEQPLWTLEKEGYAVVRTMLPEDMLSEGYLSEHPEHDLLCTGFLMGEFLKKVPSHVNIVTEQEMRTLDYEFLPDWVPNPERHRPDGYWRVKDGDVYKKISLEVEPTQKASTRYQGYSYFYEDFSEQDRVLWIVKSRKHAIKILKSMYDNTRDAERVHNIVYLKDILKDGWDAIIIGGIDKGIIVRDLFCVQTQYNASSLSVPMFHEYIKERSITYQINSGNHKTPKIKKLDSTPVASKYNESLDEWDLIYGNHV